MNPTDASASGPSPIADRSYRSYDGSLRSHATRWWVVALSNLRATIKKPAFWILSGIGTIPYIFAGISFKLNTMAAMFGSPTDHPYASHMFDALRNQEFWIFLTALVVGTNVIAADVRANALLIYLSKPITKGDYLLGKWMGTFLPLYGATVLPAALFYLASALGLFGSDFWSTEPSVVWRMALASAVPAVVHSSILVGVSAWSKSGRVAGAVYAGLYLITGIIFGIIGGLQMRAHRISNTLIGHFSVSGAIQGLTQCIYHVKLPVPPWRQQVESQMPTPAFLWEMLALCAAMSIIGIAMARAKINAVEVVRG